jgi:hypothetical protein
MPVISFQTPGGQLAHFQVPDGMALDEARSIIQARFRQGNGGATMPTAGTSPTSGTAPTAGAPMAPLGFPALPGLPKMPELPRPDDSAFYRYTTRPEEPAPYKQQPAPKESLADIMNRLRRADTSAISAKGQYANGLALTGMANNMLLNNRLANNFAFKDPTVQSAMGLNFNSLMSTVDPSLYRRASTDDAS